METTTSPLFQLASWGNSPSHPALEVKGLIAVNSDWHEAWMAHRGGLNMEPCKVRTPITLPILAPLLQRVQAIDQVSGTGFERAERRLSGGKEREGPCVNLFAPVTDSAHANLLNARPTAYFLAHVPELGARNQGVRRRNCWPTECNRVCLPGASPGRKAPHAHLRHLPGPVLSLDP